MIFRYHAQLPICVLSLICRGYSISYLNEDNNERVVANKWRYWHIEEPSPLLSRVGSLNILSANIHTLSLEYSFLSLCHTHTHTPHRHIHLIYPLRENYMFSSLNYLRMNSGREGQKIKWFSRNIDTK